MKLAKRTKEQQKQNICERSYPIQYEYDVEWEYCGGMLVSTMMVSPSGKKRMVKICNKCGEEG